MSGRVFVKSRPLDVHRWSDFPEVSRCLGEIAAEIEAQENRKRLRSKKDGKAFRHALAILVLDLYAAWKVHPALQVAISLRSNDFSRNTRYDALFLSYKPFKTAYDGLKALGYLVVDKEGNFDRARGK